MFRHSQILLAFAVCLASATNAVGQVPLPPLNSPTQPVTQKELDQREALHWYAKGVLCQKDSRLLEALRAYESASKLDPDGVPIHKALLSINISLDRHEEATALLKKVLDLDPQDHEATYLYSRHLRSRDKLSEACEVLQKGLQSIALRDLPQLHQQMECDLGVLCEQLAKSQEAAAAFARAVAIVDHPDRLLEGRLSPEECRLRSAELHERIGRNLLQVSDFDGAAAEFRRAQAMLPTGAVRLYYHLAQISLRQGKLIEAEASLREYLKMLPPGIEAYELMIGVLRKQKRDADIVPLLEHAAQFDTFNVGLLLLLARTCVQDKQPAKAEKVFLELARTGPSPQIYRDLFLLYKDHHPRRAEFIAEMVNDSVQKAVTENNPLANNPAPAQSSAMVTALRENSSLARDVLRAGAKLSERQSLNANTLQIFAAIADRHEMLAESEVFYRQCLQQPLSPAAEPLVYGGMLRVLWKARRPEAIVEVCRAGLKQVQANNRVVLRSSLAEALGQLQRWKEALDEADQALREPNSGDDFKLRLMRVRLLTQADKIAEAEAECEALRKSHHLPGEVLEIRYLLANVYSMSARMPQAEAELTECLKIDPASPAVNNDLGYWWADQNKNLVEAEAMIRKAIEQDRKARQGLLFMQPEPDRPIAANACYLDSLGWVLFRRGELEAARKELEEASKLPDGDDPVIWDHLGDVYQALGRAELALTAWRQAIHFYEEGKRRKMDERYRTLKEKLKAASGG